MSDSPFDHLARLTREFSQGLETMLEKHGGLGVYILVLGNAAYDPALWPAFRAALAARHVKLADALIDTLRAGARQTEPEDDLMVFLKLHTLGFERLGQPETRTLDPWRVQFNPLRALRPPRASGQRYSGLARPYDPTGFQFNKPFLAREIFWQGELAGRGARLLYNKFPFARLHGLVVPEPARGWPQQLTRDLHDWAWQVCSEAGIAGFYLGYNSLGAGASVNHLHFQSFVDDALPVAAPAFAHNGGARAYPLACDRCDDADAGWTRIAALHARDTPYNLIYTRGAVYVVARRPQDDPALDDAQRGWGWSEMAGALTLFSREAYAAQEAAGFEAALARFASG